jgi:hypothetical protein
MKNSYRHVPGEVWFRPGRYELKGKIDVDMDRNYIKDHRTRQWIPGKTRICKDRETEDPWCSERSWWKIALSTATFRNHLFALQFSSKSHGWTVKSVFGLEQHYNKDQCRFIREHCGLVKKQLKICVPWSDIEKMNF